MLERGRSPRKEDGMPLEISCSFPAGLETPDHIVAAERLGYRRAWCYDSPALYSDVWITLARAAERTSRSLSARACWSRTCATS
jgi:alkanesulfonate monooxygenase SsuD/methylene tetrahydromethanopterin reductase-like flavin-dependent oxidoreductase (luciferase family)